MSVVRKSKLNIPIRKQRSTGIELGRTPESLQQALKQENNENIEIHIAGLLLTKQRFRREPSVEAWPGRNQEQTLPYAICG